MARDSRSFSLLGAAMASSLILAACTSEPEEPGAPEENDAETDHGETVADENGETAEGPEEGGNLIITLSADIHSLDPHGSNDNQSSKARTALYDTLVIQDEDMELQPNLAETYEQVEDDVWEFQLREDVSFHDGEELNAEAVVKNFERLLDEELASERAFLYTMIENIEVIDEYTVQMTTAYPFAPLPAHLAHDAGGIISPAAIDADESGEMNLDIEAAGTGPFELEDWTQGEQLILSRNDNYWGDSAYLDTVTFQVIPEELPRIGMLENNEAHVADLIEPANTTRVDEIEHASLVTVPSLSLTYVGFNVEKEPFDDVRVRQAVSLAVNNDEINEGIYQGYGVPAKGPINELVFGYDENLEALGYDPERAQELLAEAGYEDGFETTLWTNDDNPLRSQTSQVIQDQLSDIGIDVSLQNVEWGAYLDATAEGEHDMYVLGWVTVTGDADYGMYSLFHSDNFGAPGNRSFYENADVDQLLDDARQEGDEETREQLYHEAQELLVEEAPMIYTVFDEMRIGVADSVENFIQHPNGLFDFSETYITEADDDVSY